MRTFTSIVLMNTVCNVLEFGGGRRHRCHHHGDRDRRGARCPPFRTSGHRAGAERLCEATSVNRCHLSVCSVLWVTLSTRPVRYRWAARIVGTVRALWCVPVWPEGDAMMKLAATAIVTLVFAGPRSEERRVGR